MRIQASLSLDRLFHFAGSGGASAPLRSLRAAGGGNLSPHHASPARERLAVHHRSGPMGWKRARGGSPVTVDRRPTPSRPRIRASSGAASLVLSPIPTKWRPTIPRQRRGGPPPSPNMVGARVEVKDGRRRAWISRADEHRRGRQGPQQSGRLNAAARNSFPWTSFSSATPADSLAAAAAVRAILFSARPAGGLRRNTTGHAHLFLPGALGLPGARVFPGPLRPCR